MKLRLRTRGVGHVVLNHPLLPIPELDPGDGPTLLLRPNGRLEHFGKGQGKLGLIGFVLLVLLIVGGIRLADYVIERRAAARPSE